VRSGLKAGEVVAARRPEQKNEPKTAPSKS
jgi:hypothetical protein